VGVEVKGECLTTNPKSTAFLGRNADAFWEGTLLHEHVSAPLKEIVAQTNIHSLNHYADALLLSLVSDKGKMANYPLALDALTKFMQKAGISTEDLYFEDGSGICASSAISCQDLGQLLLWSQKQKWYGSFYESLPVAGRNGTLKDAAKGMAAEGKLHAKTGSIMKVQNYAGYLETKGGRKLVVVLMLNKYTGRFSAMRAASMGFFSTLANL
jgi:D-alanyl-D-alanine carboxypeptidase/D-alanyl-D-alanine-endopeptidase (penicillin-binding protein 4)